MKLSLILIFAAVGLSTSCKPLSSRETTKPTSFVPVISTSTPIAEPPAMSSELPVASPTEFPGQSTSTTTLGQMEREEDEGDKVTATLDWNPEPTQLILFATFCCGKVSRVTLMNYIPDAQLWGDGRIVWTEFADDGQRRVLEGRLTTEQIQALLEQMNNTGFFGWQELYADSSIADASEQCLVVETDVKSKKVCEYVAGAPQAFHDLYAYIAAGAGATGQDYIPATGYLTAHPLPIPSNLTPPADFNWPADLLKLSLEQTTDGMRIEGKALETSWQVVNIKWRGSIIEDGKNYYSISLQIPDLNGLGSTNR